jgi:hypothetical protein
MHLTQCFVDESIYDDLGIVVTAFVFGDTDFEGKVTGALLQSGIDSPREEFKSSARMDSDPRMPKARDALLALAGKTSRIAVFFGPFGRPRLGLQTLQAAQSVVLRNANTIDRQGLSVYVDREVFPSQKEADRLHGLFNYLQSCRISAVEDSKIRVGIQVADCVAHSFGQIIKAALTGQDKTVDVGGPNTGYVEGTEAPLGWTLLMSLRYALLTRPIIYVGESYPPECDPLVLDPYKDDPADFGQHPVLLGWGVQVAPEANQSLRLAVESKLGRVWLGCIH